MSITVMKTPIEMNDVNFREEVQQGNLISLNELVKLTSDNLLNAMDVAQMYSNWVLPGPEKDIQELVRNLDRLESVIPRLRQVIKTNTNC